MKILLLCLSVLLFAGCSSSPSDCKNQGWKGVVIRDYYKGFFSCSNGEITPDGKSYLTDNGTIDTSGYIFFRFEK